jgi:hypothetical protein
VFRLQFAAVERASPANGVVESLETLQWKRVLSLHGVVAAFK